MLAFKFLTYELCVAANMPEFAHYLSKEQQDELRSIAQAIVAPGKGILAADESVGQFPAFALPLWLITQWDPPGTINIRRPSLFWCYIWACECDKRSWSKVGHTASKSNSQ